MTNFLEFVGKYKNDFFSFLGTLYQQEKKLLIVGEINELFRKYRIDNPNIPNGLEEIVKHLQELIIHNSSMFLDFRVRIGYSEFYTANIDEEAIYIIPVKDYLIAKEKSVNEDISDNIVTLDFKPFYENYPSVRDDSNIGEGVDYLNKFLSSKMFNDIDKWKEVLFNYVKLHKYNNQQLILNDRIESTEHLIQNIKETIKKLGQLDDATQFEEIKHELQNLGFEMGLGKDVKEIKSNLKYNF